MRGIARLHMAESRKLCGLSIALLLLVSVVGCSKPAGQPNVVQAGKGGVTSRSNEPQDGAGLGSQPPDEARPADSEEGSDENDMEPAEGETIHHHHHFAPWPPGRLTPFQYDRTDRVIHWPPLLRDKRFSDVRFQLDLLFDKRKPGNSGLQSENYVQIKQQCEAMLGILARMMDQLNSDDFVGACAFVKALEDEARFPEK